MAVRLVRVNRDGDGLDGLRRITVVMPTMPMIAVRSLDMGCLRLGDDHRRMLVTVCMAVFMAACAVEIPFRLKRFIDGFNRQAHGVQHVASTGYGSIFRWSGFSSVGTWRWPSW